MNSDYGKVAHYRDLFSSLSDEAFRIALASLAISLIVVMIIEFIKPIFRHLYHKATILTWNDNLLHITFKELVNRDARATAPADGSMYSAESTYFSKKLLKELDGHNFTAHLFGVSIAPRGLGRRVKDTFGERYFAAPRAIVMRRFRLSAQRFIDAPMQSTSLLYYLSSGLSVDERIRFLEWITENSGRTSDVPEHIELISQKLAAAIERNLDELELLLKEGWPRYLMYWAVSIGAVSAACLLRTRLKRVMATA